MNKYYVKEGFNLTAVIVSATIKELSDNICLVEMNGLLPISETEGNKTFYDNIKNKHSDNRCNLDYVKYEDLFETAEQAINAFYLTKQQQLNRKRIIVEHDIMRLENTLEEIDNNINSIKEEYEKFKQ